MIVDEPRSPGAFFVGIDDQRRRARSAAAHVASLGHGRVAIIADRLVDDRTEGLAAPERIARSNCKVSRERVAGYIAGLDSLEPVPVFEALGQLPPNAASAPRARCSSSRRGRPRCSAPPTCSRSARSRRCASAGSTCPATSRSPASTTCPAAARGRPHDGAPAAGGEGPRGRAAADGARHRARGDPAGRAGGTRLDRPRRRR